MGNLIASLPRDRAGLLNVRDMLYRRDETADTMLSKKIDEVLEIVNARLADAS